MNFYQATASCSPWQKRQLLVTDATSAVTDNIFQPPRSALQESNLSMTSCFQSFPHPRALGSPPPLGWRAIPLAAERTVAISLSCLLFLTLEPLYDPMPSATQEGTSP
ncbi:hypothetical protein T10_8343 [Trichinella papuae]|uniref:Uncharacterized protein n=1 Tax=Trichinella papuae TaxID=268474 RepID=A0A0V1M2M7_9BILA|nr:hypothetical protein T10_8343 [Trichinella papuae]